MGKKHTSGGVYETLIETWGLRSFWGVNQPVTTNGSWDMKFGKIYPFGPFFAKKCHFRWSNKYMIYETLIGTYILRSFWGVNQLVTTNGSWDMKFGKIYPFGPFFAKKYHFRWSNKYMIYETLIGTYILRSFWGVNQLSTSSGSKDINFPKIWQFFAKIGNIFGFC